MLVRELGSIGIFSFLL